MVCSWEGGGSELGSGDETSGVGDCPGGSCTEIG